MEQLKPRDKRADKVLPDQTAVKPNDLVSHDTVLYFAGRLAEADAVRRAANKAYSSIRKQFKNTGVTVGTFDHVLRLSELDDENAITSYLREFLHIAEAFSAVPQGTQLGLFAGNGSAVEAKDKAYKMGYVLSMMGKNPDEQAYAPGTDIGQEHLRGWHDGQTKRQNEFLAHNEQVRQEEQDKKDKAAEAARKKAEKLAKDEEKAGRKVPVTEKGDTVQ